MAYKVYLNKAVKRLIENYVHLDATHTQKKPTGKQWEAEQPI